MPRTRSDATINLPDHGEFMASIDDVNRYAAWSKRKLATAIAECYAGNWVAGGDKAAETAQYWLKYEHWALAIIYAGLVAPRN
jgi:hypothetical protein